MLFRQTLFAKTLKFFISVMAFKEIRQTLLIRTAYCIMRTGLMDWTRGLDSATLLEMTL